MRTCECDTDPLWFLLFAVKNVGSSNRKEQKERKIAWTFTQSQPLYQLISGLTWIYSAYLNQKCFIDNGGVAGHELHKTNFPHTCAKRKVSSPQNREDGQDTRRCGELWGMIVNSSMAQIYMHGDRTDQHIHITIRHLIMMMNIIRPGMAA